VQGGQFLLVPALSQAFAANVFRLANDSYLHLNLSDFADLLGYEIDFNFGFTKNLSDVLRPAPSKSSNRLVLLLLVILGGAAFILLVVILFRYIASRDAGASTYKASFQEKSTL